MFYNLPYKTKQFLSLLVKLSIVFGTAYFVYHRLTNNQQLDFEVFMQALQSNRIFTWTNILVLIGLSMVNWLLETIKWKTLIGTIKKISFKEAWEQSLGSLTASLFTPNRIGEYGAKAIYYARNHRKKVLFLNLWSNMMQMSVTMLLGLVGIFFFLSSFQVEVNYFRIMRIVILALVLVALGFFGLRHRKLQIKGFSFQKVIDFVKNMTFSIHLRSWLLSLARYSIFSFQWYFLLKIFGTDIAYLNAMMFITSMYLIASLVPTVFIFDVVIRGGAAVWLFGFIEVNELRIVCITTLMWLLNFVFPSIFGSYYVLNFGKFAFQDEKIEAP